MKRTIALIYGGASSEYEISLESSNSIFKALNRKRYNILRYDVLTDLNKFISDANTIDFAFIAMHGKYGEDGSIQGLLDMLDIPYQSSGVLGSTIAMNKLVSKILYKEAGLTVPPYIVLSSLSEFQASKIIRQLNLPVIVKPVSSGSSFGMSIIEDAEELEKGVKLAFKYDHNILVESYISGIEISVGVIGNKELETLPPIEIRPNGKYKFFDYEAKYVAGASEEICPANISRELSEKAKHCARLSHEILLCQGYSRTDMIIGKGKFNILETNTIPGMTDNSLFPKAAKVNGISFPELLEHLIRLGIERHKLSKNLI